MERGHPHQAAYDSRLALYAIVDEISAADH
jgi:hypothetical protein